MIKAAVAVAICATIVVALQINFQHEDALFARFMQTYNRTYASDAETAHRLGVFKQNLARINQLNTKYPGVTFKVNKFADLSKEEFKKFYLSAKPMVRDYSEPVAAEYPESVIKATPTSWDWRTKGVVTGVKDQGQCGSCWSFSTTGNIEGQWALAGNKLVGLSEQNLVDCDHTCSTYMGEQACDDGCNGGLMQNAYQYVIKNGGIDTEASYPYQAYANDQCGFKPTNVGAKIRNYTMLSQDEKQIAAYLVQHGPVSIAANAEEWQFYYAGVFYLPCATQLDHGILIVGFGNETDIFDQYMPYWIVKNSWGADWGESGYIRIERGVGKCGLNQYASSSIV
jgi:cathepsin F